MTGLQEFKLVLSEYRNLSVWAAGASVIFPFIASFLSIIPPWPAGLNVITAIVQLVALIVAYQRFSGVRKIVTRNVTALAISFVTLVLAYSLIFTQLTIYVPLAKRSIVTGFSCVDDAVQLYGTKCPHLGLQELSNAAFDEFLLWTKSSIAAARTLLIALWFAIFICLASLIAQFLVFQMRRTLANSKA